MSEHTLSRDELTSISDRAYLLAKESRDPGMRTALQLLAESAINVAIKLPQPPEGKSEIREEGSDQS